MVFIGDFCMVKEIEEGNRVFFRVNYFYISLWDMCLNEVLVRY